MTFKFLGSVRLYFIKFGENLAITSLNIFLSLSRTSTQFKNISVWFQYTLLDVRPEELGSETGCKSHLTTSCVFTGGSVVKNLSTVRETQETWIQSLGQEDPWRRKWLPTLVFCLGEFHGLYSLWDHKESDTIE